MIFIVGLVVTMQWIMWAIFNPALAIPDLIFKCVLMFIVMIFIGGLTSHTSARFVR